MRLRRGKKNDQAKRLRAMFTPGAASTASPPADAAPLVVLIGAKGGVGTTTLVWRLAQSLKLAGDTPLAVDAHLWQPELARAAGMSLEEGATLADVLAGDAAPADAVRIGDGPALLPGAWRDAPDANAGTDLGRRLVSDVGAPLSDKFNPLVVDAGPARTPWAAALCQAARLVLLVATPDELSLLGAYSFLKQSNTGDAPPTATRLLVNRAANEGHARETHARIRDTCRVHLGDAPPLAGWLPHDARLARRDAPPAPLLRPIARRVRETLSAGVPSPPAARAA